MPTEMELQLEQTQQGSSYEVLVSAEGVEELKRKVKIKGEKESLLTLRQKPEHAEYDESNTYVLERFNTTAGNPIKEILLKLNLLDHSVKVKEIQERCIIKAFKLSYQEKYEHGGPEVTRLQEGKRSQDDDKRLCLVDDLKKLKNTFKLSTSYQAKA
ncbi:hypothetical protein Tco_0642384 [Tanacetum coccineum]